MLSQGDDKGRHNEGPDVLSEAAMINAYYICHNVQVNWQAQQNREGSKKTETVAKHNSLSISSYHIYRYAHDSKYKTVPKQLQAVFSGEED